MYIHRQLYIHVRIAFRRLIGYGLCVDYTGDSVAVNRCCESVKHRSVKQARQEDAHEGQRADEAI